MLLCVSPGWHPTTASWGGAGHSGWHPITASWGRHCAKHLLPPLPPNRLTSKVHSTQEGGPPSQPAPLPPASLSSRPLPSCCRAAAVGRTLRARVAAGCTGCAAPAPPARPAPEADAAYLACRVGPSDSWEQSSCRKSCMASPRCFSAVCSRRRREVRACIRRCRCTWSGSGRGYEDLHQPHASTRRTTLNRIACAQARLMPPHPNSSTDTHPCGGWTAGGDPGSPLECRENHAPGTAGLRR